MTELDAKAIARAHNLKPEYLRAQMIAQMIEDYETLWRRYRAGDVALTDLPAHKRNAVTTLEHYTAEPAHPEPSEAQELPDPEQRERVPFPGG